MLSVRHQQNCLIKEIFSQKLFAFYFLLWCTEAVFSRCSSKKSKKADCDNNLANFTKQMCESIFYPWPATLL